MATSETDVANSALILLGADRINSLEEDSKEARVMKELFPNIRDQLLRAHPWNFAINTIQLAEIATAPPASFSKRFQIPSNVLRVLRVHDGTVGDTNFHESRVAIFPWERKKQEIWTDLSPTYADVIERIETVAHWDANFAEVVAMLLAAKSAYAIVQSITLAQQLFGAYQGFLALARSYDGQEGSTMQVTASDFLDARF
jgi:hypothetical protein